MKRRDFLFRATPVVAATFVGSSLAGAAQAGDLASMEDVKLAMADGPVVVIIGGVDASMEQFHNVKQFIASRPGFQIPVFVLDPEGDTFYAQPGTLLIMRDGYVEVQRADVVSEADLQFVFEAVMMNEGGKG